MKNVICTTDGSIVEPHTTKGTEAEVTASFKRHAELWYALREQRGGTTFYSPAVFWEEK